MTSALLTGAALAADTLFLAMFLGAAAIEANGCPREAAYAFAAQWRHGMAGNSPLYMPGFFATAAALWYWSMGRRLSRVIAERTILLALSLALAVMTAPSTAALALLSFQDQAGTLTSAAREIPLALVSFQGAYTLVAWSAFVIGSRLAIERRSFKPLAPALVAGMLLVVVRPWTVDEFGSFWWRRTLEGDPLAVVSSALVFVVAGALAASQIAHERRRRARPALMAGPAAGNPAARVAGHG